MKVIVRYSTNEKISVGNGFLRFVYNEAELEVVMFIRYACGSVGAAANRYGYNVVCKAPSDAYTAFICDGEIRENLNRKLNKHFNPKDFNWVGNVAKVETSK